MKETDYATAVARVRVNENNLLENSDVERLISAKSLDEAVSLLNEKGYSKQGEDISHLFDNQLEDAWGLIKEVAPDKSEFDFLLVKNDFHNLKAILKGVITGKDYSSLLLNPTVIDTELIENAIKNQKFDILPFYMADTAKSAYDFFVTTFDGQLSDLCIDKGSLEAVIKLSENNENEFIRNLGEIIVATYNLRIAVRGAKTNQSADVMKEALANCNSLSADRLAQAAAAGIDEVTAYIQSSTYSAAADKLGEGIAEFEKWCDNALIDFVSSARYSCFGPAPLASFIVKKEAQLKTVRIIVSAKISGLDNAVIRQRIREVY